MIATSLLLLLFTPNLPAETPATTSPVGPTLEEEEDVEWTGSFNLAGTYQSGNSNQQSLAVGFNTERRSKKDWTIFDAWWQTAQQNEDTKTRVRTEENLGAKLQYRYFLSEKLFWNAITGFRIDHPAKLTLRYDAGGGVGYQFIEDDDKKLSGEIGLTYFKEEYSRGGQKPSGLALRAAYRYSNQLTETTNFKQVFEIIPNIDDFDDYTMELGSGIDVKMSDSMSLIVEHILNYDSTPAPTAGKNDNKVLVGIRWTF